MKFVEMFAGIGGMSHGLEQAGMECVAFAEWDKFAHKAYNILHNEDNRKVAWKDVTEVTDGDLFELRERTGGIDVLAAGFPCQSFSIAGHRRGFEDTRGTLFFDVARWASILKPKYLLLENVKGLLNHDSGRTFGVILQTLDELGYDAEWQVLNSKNFGVPQNRERVFIVGHSRNGSRREVFPIGRKNENTISIVGKLQLNKQEMNNRVYGVDGLAPTIRTMQGGGLEPKILIDAYNQKLSPENGTISPSLTTECGHKSNRTGIKVLEPKIMVVGSTKPENCTRQGNRDYVYDEDGLMGCLSATDYKQPKQVLIREEARAIITPERMEKRQHGRRAKEVGEPMFTITAQDRHGVILPLNPSKEDGSQYYHQDCVFDVEGIMPALTSIVQNVGLPIKEATKTGYKMANVGDSVNFQQPNSETRRGRVGKGVANTLETKENQGVVTSDYRIRKLTPLECFRLQSFPDSWYHKLVESGFSNSQLYKMAGNAVTSSVVREIARRIVDEKDKF